MRACPAPRDLSGSWQVAYAAALARADDPVLSEGAAYWSALRARLRAVHATAKGTLP